MEHYHVQQSTRSLSLSIDLTWDSSEEWNELLIHTIYSNPWLKSTYKTWFDGLYSGPKFESINLALIPLRVQCASRFVSPMKYQILHWTLFDISSFIWSNMSTINSNESIFSTNDACSNQYLSVQTMKKSTNGLILNQIIPCWSSSSSSNQSIHQSINQLLSNHHHQSINNPSINN